MIPPRNPAAVIAEHLTPVADELSPRQRIVWEGLAKGFSDREIAEAQDPPWRTEDVRMLRLVLECYAYRVVKGPLPTGLDLDTLFQDFSVPLPRALRRYAART